jgi:hypothetical protein
MTGASRDDRSVDRFSIAFRNRLRPERGAYLVWLALSLTAFIGLAGLAIDVGAAYNAKRKLQNAEDSAALAGAQVMPCLDAMAPPTGTTCATTAQAIARYYLSQNGFDPKGFTFDYGCAPMGVADKASCAPYFDYFQVNTTTVISPNTFAKAFGALTGNNFNAFTPSAASGACDPCTLQHVPYDVVIVQDRTGSMSSVATGGDGGLAAAQSAIPEFLKQLNPTYDQVALFTFPPVANGGTACQSPQQNQNFYNYDSVLSPYMAVPFSTDYQNANGTINANSALVKTEACFQAGGNTAYATAVDQAQAYLTKSGRANAKKLIVFFTDGAANIGPHYYAAGSGYRTTPCAQGVAEAQAAAAAGTIIFTIGYDSSTFQSNPCEYDRAAGIEKDVYGSGTIVNGKFVAGPLYALMQMASSPSNFFDNPNGGSIDNIFAFIGKLVGTGGVELTR